MSSSITQILLHYSSTTTYSNLSSIIKIQTIYLTIRESWSKAFSSIFPRELYIKNDERNIDKMKIFMSRSLFYWKEPTPSVSIRSILQSSDFVFPFTSKSSGQIQSPFVQGLTVDPTVNAFGLFNIIRFSRKLFPVLDFPMMATTASFPVMF